MFNKDIILKRKELLIDSNKSELTIDMNDQTLEYLEKVSIELGLDIEDIIVSCIIDMLIEKFELPNNIDKVIDYATFLIDIKEITNSGLNYLVLETTNLNEKFRIIVK